MSDEVEERRGPRAVFSCMPNGQEGKCLAEHKSGEHPVSMATLGFRRQEEGWLENVRMRVRGGGGLSVSFSSFQLEADLGIREEMMSLEEEAENSQLQATN